LLHWWGLFLKQSKKGWCWPNSFSSGWNQIHKQSSVAWWCPWNMSLHFNKRNLHYIHHSTLCETFSLDPINHPNGAMCLSTSFKWKPLRLAKIFKKSIFKVCMYQCHMGYVNISITYYAIPMHSSTLLVLEYVPM
jgi:hypothetical protein